MSSDLIVLGAGMTGLAAGIASGAPVFEARDVPGGICSSYYVSATTGQKSYVREDPDSYRFELGGGHWIFGGDTLALRLVSSLTPLKRYERRSSVYLPDREQLIPYPIQNSLSHLQPSEAASALSEIVERTTPIRRGSETLEEWLLESFGPTLTALFFGPFHELYTAGLWRSIAPQDPYKSPVSLDMVVAGAFGTGHLVGYNTSFAYPVAGLDEVARGLAGRADVRYGHRVEGIDVSRREAHFGNGAIVRFESLLSTLPLNRVLELADVDCGTEPHPASSVLVVNIGGIKGPDAPSDHWVYVPHSETGFHRVGFYSNVDRSFLPQIEASGSRVSIYVELGRPDTGAGVPAEAEATAAAVVRELMDWGWLAEPEVVDTTWIDVAYTWSWPRSAWRTAAVDALAEHGIHQVGRYGRWTFQGIADSIRDGLMAGASFR